MLGSLTPSIAAAFAVSIACASLATGYWLRGLRADAEMAQVLREVSAETSRRVTAALRASEQARSEESRRAFEMERISRDAQAKAEQARRDASAAASAADRLRQRAAALAAQCAPGGAAGSPPAAAASTPASAPVVVLADVLGRAAGRAAELAAAYDASAVAGRACEAAYDSLKP